MSVYYQNVRQVGYNYELIDDSCTKEFDVDRFIFDFNNYSNWVNWYESIDKDLERSFVDNIVKYVSAAKNSFLIEWVITVLKNGNRNNNVRIEIFPQNSYLISLSPGWKAITPNEKRSLFRFTNFKNVSICQKVELNK